MVEDDQFGPVVIDTAAVVEQRHAVVARWSDAGEVRVVADATRPSLVFSWAWSASGRLYVAGLTCPSPRLDDIDVFDEDFAEGCGGHEPFYAVRVLDLADRSWSEVIPEVPLLVGRAVNVVSPGETTMVVGAGSKADPTVQALYRIDLRTGATTPIPEGSALEGSPERRSGDSSPSATSVAHLPSGSPTGRPSNCGASTISPG